MSLKRRNKQAARRKAEEISPAIREVISALSRVQKKLPHPVVGIVIATLVAITGRGELQLRSYGLLMIAMWLSIDLWVWILAQPTRWKWIVAGSAPSIMLISVMWIMYSGLQGRLEDQQDDVYQHLELHVRPSSNAQNVMFTMKNGGTTDLGPHGIACNLSIARFENSVTLEDMLLERTPESDRLVAGDAESSSCLSVSPVKFPMVCADMTVHVQYVLATQPETKRDRLFRFFGHKDGAEFVWDQQPVNTAGRFCR